jgi:16S rRNA (uracil1498-N3)-methyltransferase
MQRIYTNEKLAGNSAIISDPEIAHRLNSVLRLKKGGRFYLFDSSGSEFLAEITEISGKKVSVGFVDRIERNTQPKRTLNLYPSLFKKQRFEWMLEKCTEIGVRSFNPVVSEHSVIKEFAVKSAAENRRWQKIMVSAAEQSEHVFVPKINPIQDLSDALILAEKNIFVAAERLAVDTSDLASQKTFAVPTVNLFIGPEGGWSAAELELFKKHGAKFISFGKNILRSETACIAGTVIALL